MEVAGRTQWPVEPFAHGHGDPLACELRRQAIRWLLLAHAPADSASSEPELADTEKELAVAWERVDRELLVRAAGDSTALERVRADVGKSYVEYFGLPPAEQREVASRLERFAEELALPLRNARRRRERVWLGRAVRLALVAIVLVLAAGMVHRLLVWNEERRDLARGAHWTASSVGWSGGCRSPEQRCVGGETYFFHTTQEPNPWVMFDLAERKEFSAVRVEHRPDCCPERAVPLVISVSNDKRTWKQVARRDEPFVSWNAEFEPVRARWVKLEIARTSILHLSSVRIFP